MSRGIRRTVVLMFILLSLAAGKMASAVCIDNPNSSMVYIDGEYTCAYSGGGCSACFTRGSRGGDSWDMCYYDWNSGDLDCTYYM